MNVRHAAIVFCCALAAGTAAASAAETPAARCARLRDDDRVRPIPQALAAPARKALGLADTAGDADLLRATVYRCMDGVVWVCSHGANLSCAKADVARASPGADAWCKANPGASVAPAYAAGHDTVYSWGCAGTKAVAGRAAALDRRGFAADQWKPIRDSAWLMRKSLFALVLLAAPPAQADDAAAPPAYWGRPSADGGKCCATLADVRANIDRIDRALVRLMAERQQYVGEAGRFKKDPAAVSDPKRVDAIVTKVRADAAAQNLDPTVAEKTFRAMIAAFEDFERAEWLARQGAPPK